MNKDFVIFKKECSWFVEHTDKTEIKEVEISYSEDFSKTFPALFELLIKARTADIVLIRTKKKKETIHNYRLYSWNTKNGHTAGWLCRIEVDRPVEILSEHQLLIDNIGGIEESYAEAPETEKLTDNQNFLFIKSECEPVDEDWLDYYLDICEEEDLQPLGTENFLAFAVEANGNRTFYDLKTKQVLLFAPDHDFGYVTEAANQPEYTFYTINEVVDFVGYVEKLAKQWLDEAV